MADHESVRIVWASWAKAKVEGPHLAERFYGHLFKNEPGVQKLFDGVNIKLHFPRLFKMLNTCIENLERPETLGPLVRDMGRRHVEYGVAPEHYPPEGRWLLQTLEDVLGPSFTPEVRKAWEVVFKYIFDLMIEGATTDPDAWKLGYLGAHATASNATGSGPDAGTASGAGSMPSAGAAAGGMYTADMLARDMGLDGSNGAGGGGGVCPFPHLSGAAGKPAAAAGQTSNATTVEEKASKHWCATLFGTDSAMIAASAIAGGVVAAGAILALGLGRNSRTEF